jgi:hypothetical protein
MCLLKRFPAKDEINDVEYELNIIDYDITNDIATLSSNVNLGDGVSIIKDYNTTIGEDIFTIGNLNNNGLAYAYGKITTRNKIFNNLGSNIVYVQTNIEISG